MNHIQRAWLYVLQPVTHLMNEKLAKRSGLLGKFGRFFAVGPREFGVHPFNRHLIFWNRMLTHSLGFMLHKYSVIKGLSHNGYHMMRMFRTVAWLPLLLGLMPLVLLPNADGFYESEEGTTLEWFYKKQRYGGPANALNHRISAHFTEINGIYGIEMIKKYDKVHKEIINERNRVSEAERKTRYARAGYVYIPYNSAPDGK